jgi:hypothetical protein
MLEVSSTVLNICINIINHVSRGSCFRRDAAERIFSIYFLLLRTSSSFGPCVLCQNNTE